ncbi:MAG: multiheme c-type cytochrome [Gemmataceae bacterium]
MATPDPGVSSGPRLASLGSRRKHWIILLTTAALLFATALRLYFIFFRGSSRPPYSQVRDPRLDYSGPFQNIDPAVQYVADDRCADCHSDIARSFADHPMGRSLLPMASASPLPEDKGHNLPFDALGVEFSIVHEGNRVWQRGERLDPAGHPVAKVQLPVDYVIGSGTRGHSYLTDREGYVFQTPVSWFSQKEKWDLSPGFREDRLSGRPVAPECLYCHANRVHYVEGTMNRYQEPVFEGHAIGCQRCHGPGELHVAARANQQPVAAGPDYTIVNPRHLEASHRAAVCEQCHLTGMERIVRRGRGLDDFRPGLPLDDFWAVFVQGPQAERDDQAVGQVEQMYQSRCFQSTSGADKLGCTSCHDPHVRVAASQRIAHYRSRCLQCHEKKACSLPVAQRLQRTKEDSCIDCHMPRYDAPDIAHTASTNHRIPRDPKAAFVGKEQASNSKGFPVVSFYNDRSGSDEAENNRDLGVAIVKMTLLGDNFGPNIINRVLPFLEIALQRDPDDFAAGEARGCSLGLQHHWAESEAAFEAILARAPDREHSLVGAATAAEKLRKTDAALDYWRRAIQANPWEPAYRRRLATLLSNNKAWDEARSQCEAWIRLEPINAEARTLRVVCLLAADEKEEARAEFARVEALAPSDLVELKARFLRKFK